MDWEHLKSEFYPDSGLRDIYVLGATLHDWQVVVDAIRAFEPHPVFTVNGSPMDLPIRVEQICQTRVIESPMMSFRLLDMTLNCHFFGIDESEHDVQPIEFDLDPNEVCDMEHAQALIDFMMLLGNITGKFVILTPENCIESPILRYDPISQQVNWVPPI